MKNKQKETCGCAINTSQIFCQFGVFSKEDFELHRNETEELLKKSSERNELSDGFSFKFDGDEAMYVRLAKWVSREHQCCPWAKFELEIYPFNKQMSQNAGTIVLTITGGGSEGKQVLLEGFKILERGGN